MNALAATERAVVDTAAAQPMLAQVETWAPVNSGSRNLDGLEVTATLLADAFAILPGEVAKASASSVAVTSRPRCWQMPSRSHAG